jgi:outer membrane receptor protein involved in Fe transport
MQPLGNYFARIKVGTDTVTANKDMDFSKAHHFVLGYTNNLSANWHFKTEVYYQSLYNIPVTSGRNTSFSMLNQDDDYVIDKLQNTGKGKNYGVEFTVERSWNELFYMIATASLYESKYLPSDQIWRNTRFNSNTGFTFLSGKEWALQHLKRPTSFSLDIKMVQNGGVRVTPIDLGKSIQQKKTVLNSSRIYEEKLPSFFRVDLQAAWKTQFRRMTLSVLAGVQNLTDHLNPTSQSYEPATNSITYKYLLRRIPLFGVKADF